MEHRFLKAPRRTGRAIALVFCEALKGRAPEDAGGGASEIVIGNPRLGLVPPGANKSSQNGQILRHPGCRFGVQPSGCTDQGRLKPELQTGRAQRMAGCYEERSLLLAQRLRPLHQPLLHPAALTLIKLRLRHRRLHVRLGVESASL